jgi:hypothetical protein
MSQTNGTTVSGLGTVNNDGQNVDDKGNVQVDFVWGNFPLQPNYNRTDQPILNTANYGTNLDFSLDNHVIAETGWNGYPLYTPNTTGSITGGVVYLQFPTILGDTTGLAIDNLTDAGYAAANITTATAATNTATQPTQINVTSTTAATVTVAGGTGTWPVGTQVTIATGTGIPAAVVGSWYVTGGTSSTLVIAGTGWTVADSGAITPGTKLTGKSGTLKSYTLGAGTTATQTTASTITVTPWA